MNVPVRPFTLLKDPRNKVSYFIVLLSNGIKQEGLDIYIRLLKLV